MKEARGADRSPGGGGGSKASIGAFTSVGKKK